MSDEQFRAFLLEKYNFDISSYNELYPVIKTLVSLSLESEKSLNETKKIHTLFLLKLKETKQNEKSFVKNFFIVFSLVLSVALNICLIIFQFFL